MFTTSKFVSLPAELLSEILLYLPSPKEVLAAARCSKQLCIFLTDPSAQFIWKHARTVCRPQIPNPSRQFTEASFASFIFDGGECEICHTQTESMFVSFGLRLRLCGNTACLYHARPNLNLSYFFYDEKLPKPPNTLPENYHDFVFPWTPVAESPICLYPENAMGSAYYPTSVPYIRPNDLDKEMEEYAKQKEQGTLTQYISAHANDTTRNVEFMTVCVALHKWRLDKESLLRKTKSRNDALLRKIAAQAGYDLHVLKNAPTVKCLLAAKARLGSDEGISGQEFDLVADVIEQEIAALQMKYAQRKEDAMSRRAHSSIRFLHHHLRSFQGYDILPSSGVFCQLPIIAAHLASPEAFLPCPKKEDDKVVIDLFAPSQPAGKLLRSQIEQWTKEAKLALQQILGYPSWNVARADVLAPIDRVTARFLCSRCDSVSIKDRKDESFDVAGACAHVCPDIEHQKTHLRQPWDPSTFVKDEKAISTITTFLKLLNIDPSNPDSRTIFEVDVFWVVCRSCYPPLIVNIQALFGHSHRHDNMQMILMEGPNNDPVAPERGACDRLLGPQRRMKRIREQLKFGCRHCLNANERTDKQDDVDIRKLTFNGLRSHLKYQHQIPLIRDEDMLCFEAINWNAVGEPDEEKDLVGLDSSPTTRLDWNRLFA